jgi:ligand-binding sensor domain-containing protein
MRVGVALALLALWGATAADAQVVPSRWRPDEMVVIGDCSVVLAVGAGSDLVYAVTTTGIGLFDARFDRWELPVRISAALLPPMGAPALVDPVDRSLWVGGQSGLLHYDPRLEVTETVAVPGGAYDLMFDRDDTFSGLYVRSRIGWHLVARGSGFLSDVTSLPPPDRQIRAPRIEEMQRTLPGLAARSLAPSDARLRSYRFTAGGEIRATGDVFVGTDGMGLLRLDPVTQALEPVPFGLVGTQALAVAVTSDGVVVGSGARDARRGFTWVSADLQRFRQDEGPPATGFRFTNVLDLAGTELDLWAATDRGVWRVGADGRAVREASALVGDAEVAYAVAQVPGGAWVGTERGLFFVDEAGESRRVDAQVREPVLAILPRSDTVWVGVMRGLGFVPPGGDEVLVPGQVADEPWLRDPVVALASAGAALVAATEERVAWRDSAGAWTVERAIRGEVGRIVALQGDAGGVWILGTSGLARFRPGGVAFQVQVQQADLPGLPRDLAVDDRYLWIATDGGLVRMDRRVLAP